MLNLVVFLNIRLKIVKFTVSSKVSDKRTDGLMVGLFKGSLTFSVRRGNKYLVSYTFFSNVTMKLYFLTGKQRLYFRVISNLSNDLI